MRNYDFEVRGADGLDVHSECRCQNGVDYIDLLIKSDNQTVFPPLDIWLKDFNGKGVHALWTPTNARSKGVPLSWEGEDLGSPVKGTVSAPVGVFHDIKGDSRLSVAVSEYLAPVHFKMGVVEENGTGIAKIRLFSNEQVARSEYNVTLRIDQRAQTLEKALAEVAHWYETLGVNPMPVPEAAREPMYSTWYSFHQNLSDKAIEKQCEMAREIGCSAVIVDDGWQTDDSNRGYDFCGDWEVSSSRIPDMKAHVHRIHEMGMKYLLWFSVPFVGKKAKVWNQFKDKTLYFNHELRAAVLDVRYSDVRQYLVSNYVKAVKVWGIDGLKLDFIDELDMSRADKKACQPDPARDTESLQNAVERLLDETREAISQVNPDVMVEFRQKYIGPLMRNYGNIFRVTDCPMDFVTNRVGIADLRLFSSNTAVHSDMLMWNPEDSTEQAALQLINILFGVPQFSMRFEDLPEEHLQMSRFWLSFWTQHKKLLLDGQLSVSNPDMNYPVMASTRDNEQIVAVYADMIVNIADAPQKLILINGKLTHKVVLDCAHEQQWTAYYKDCKGSLIATEQVTTQSGLNSFDIPLSGLLELHRN